MEHLLLLVLRGLWLLIVAAIEACGRFWKWIVAPPLTHSKRTVGEAWRHALVASWPRTDGAVEHINVEECFTEWRFEVAYSYEVDGAIYSGYLVLPFARQSDTERLGSLLYPGAPLIVRYDYQHRDRPALLLSDQDCLRCLAGQFVD
jgi:hypothetical protein